MSAEVAVAYIYYNIGLILCCLDFIRNQYIEFIKRKESLRAIFEIIHHVTAHITKRAFTAFT